METHAYSTKVIIGIVLFTLATLALGVTAYVLSVSGDSRDSLDGSWSGEGDLGSFSGDISEGSIVLDLELDGLSGLYWAGDFDFDDEVVTSQANESEMSSSLLASNTSTKTFTYDDGSIFFEFGIMGVTETIELKED